MNLLSAKLQLEKIITLYKNMSQDAQNVSAIERDLMLSYIRQLYDSFLEPTPSVGRDSRPQPEPVKPAEPIYTPPPVAEAPKPAYTPPPVVETPKPVYVPPPPAPEPPKPVEPVYVPPVVETPKPVYAPPPAPISADIEALFETASAKELSDRLANTPIADLSKAFGLNDRLLITNELFAGNKALFDASLAQLNVAGSFNAAKTLLAQLAQQLNWLATEDKKRQAKQFISTVRRRF